MDTRVRGIWIAIEGQINMQAYRLGEIDRLDGSE